MIPKTPQRMQTELKLLRRDLYHYVRRLGGRQPTEKELATITLMKAKIASLQNGEWHSEIESNSGVLGQEPTPN